MTKRYLYPFIQEDLKEKMVFVGGPRQVGKTTLALSFLPTGSENEPAYLNWDNLEHRSKIMNGILPSGENLVIFDEIHKMAKWRGLIKGLYDTHKSSIAFIVTGSARLDHYRKGGDSLQGRYHYYRLHPFSIGEISSNPSASDVDRLLQFGGFPEPFAKGTEKFWRRWSRERMQRVTYGDLRDLENVRDVSLIELLIENLPQRVGSPLSIQNLREVLSVSHDSVARWLKILEALYVIFRISPFGSPRIKAVTKEQKLYLWDWSQNKENEGARFENMVASHLLKYCHFIEDTEGHDMELRYLRDKDKREIDFVVLKDKKPLFAVEAKVSDSKEPASEAAYFRARTDIPKFYQVHLGSKDFGNENTSVRVLPFLTFCKELALP